MGKDDKKKDSKKKAESAGISPAERQELEKLKADIIARKSTLKESGMSGGQINKDSEIVAWVARMNELKEKEIEEYRLKLKSEFGYSNKDINADPDMVDMQA